MLELYKKIKDLRLERGMTQTELAEIVGYSDKGMISKIENGIVDLPHSKIEEFAKIFNVTPCYLMGWEDNQNDTTALSPVEQSLLEDFRILNADGKQKLLERMDELIVIGYTKKGVKSEDSAGIA